jgi:hypothetical protein
MDVFKKRTTGAKLNEDEVFAIKQQHLSRAFKRDSK